MKLEELIADAAWLQRLAVALVGNQDDAEDLVQEARIAAWRRAPDTDRPLRPWLAKVIRDLSRMGRRSAGRRRLREEASHPTADAVTPDELLDRVRLHRRLAELVLSLDEPYRSTIVARFFEGRSCASIARRLGVPESTVRSRLRDGLLRLREQLEPDQRMKAVLVGGLAMGGKAKSTVVAAMLVALLAIVLLLVGLKLRGDGSESTATTRATIEASRNDVRNQSSQPGASHVGSDVRIPSWLAVIPGHPHSISGVVVDEGHRPVAGARVELQGWSALMADGVEERTTSASDGSFKLTPKANWVYTVVASADGLASVATQVDPRAPSYTAMQQGPATQIVSPLDHLVLVLGGCHTTVQGKVTDLRGGPVAGSVVQDLQGGMGPFGPRTTSGADGRYSMCVTPGEHRISFGAEGYETMWHVVQASGHQLVDAALAVESSLSGRLLDDVDGHPIAGAQVALWPWVWVAGGPAHRAVVTDDKGNFEVRGLGAGHFELKVWDSTHVSTQVEQVAIEPERANGPLVIRLPRGVEISGMVRSSGSPLVGKLIAVSVPELPMKPQSHWCVTGADGSFKILDAPAWPNARIEVTGYDVKAVVDTSHGALVNVQVDADPRPVFRGVVVYRGAPVANATVDAGNKQASTDATGRFEMILTPGSYRLGARSDALGARSATKLSVVVPSGEVVVDLNADATIAGTVVDTAGAPVIGATVVATGDAEKRVATTGLSGAFEIGGLASRSVTLSVQELSWSGEAPAAIALADLHTRIEGIHLVVDRPRSTLQGHVVDDHGVPVGDAAVGIIGNFGVTDESGGFALDVVGNGPFTVFAAKEMGLRGELDKVAPGSSGLVVSLHRLGSLHGSVVGMSRAHVWIRPAGGGLVSYAPRVTNGAFQVDAIEPGTYQIASVNDAGQKASASVTIVDGVTSSVTLTASSEN